MADTSMPLVFETLFGLDERVYPGGMALSSMLYGVPNFILGMAAAKVIDNFIGKISKNNSIELLKFVTQVLLSCFSIAYLFSTTMGDPRFDPTKGVMIMIGFVFGMPSMWKRVEIASNEVIRMVKDLYLLVKDTIVNGSINFDVMEDHDLSSILNPTE